jgi:hypothetical protein
MSGGGSSSSSSDSSFVDGGVGSSSYVTSGNDTMPVWLIHMASALHTLLVPQVESEFVLGVELVSALLL